MRIRLRAVVLGLLLISAPLSQSKEIIGTCTAKGEQCGTGGLFARGFLALADKLPVAPTFINTGINKADVEMVIYTALRPANWDVYLFEEDGQSRRLTDDPDLDYNAAVSPDGRWLLFCSERRGNPDLYVMDLKKPGSPRLLIDSPAMEDAPAFSPDGRWLALVSTRDGNADIFLMPFEPQQTNVELVNLTRHAGGDFNPAFSPDGEWIAFSSDRDGYRASEIYVMRRDGSDVRRLTDTAGWDGSPAWGPDPRHIYFYSDRDGTPRIYRMEADGSDAQPISPKDIRALSPAVAPDDRVAFAAQHQGRWRIASVSPDGTDLRYETHADRDYWAPSFDPATGRLICHGTGSGGDRPDFPSQVPGAFLVNSRSVVPLPDRSLRMWAIRGYFPSTSPDGREVACDVSFGRIAIGNLDSGDWRVVLDPASLEGAAASEAWRPSWSPTGDWIACTVGPTFGLPGARVDIWKFRPDGTGAVNLTADPPANNAFPDFSPDGQRIVFRSGRDGNHEISMMDADGENVRRLTDHPAVDTMPAFSPRGDAVVFTSERDDDYEIYLLNLTEDGQPGPLRRLTHSPGRDTHPKFSPDSQWVVLASERGGLNDEEPLIPIFNPQPYGDIYALRIADGLVIRLTHNKWEDGTPTWAQIPK